MLAAWCEYECSSSASRGGAGMDGYTIEIDELRDNLVVLIVPTLRLLVFGRTLDEAMRRAKASIDFRVVDTGPTLVGMTRRSLPAMDCRTGRTRAFLRRTGSGRSRRPRCRSTRRAARGRGSRAPRHGGRS